ncbi:hypothetical protein [Agromyces sp. NPDC058126]|uniref:hypothetical protein n=1 Tax=Agromyces sp. NPDC058126 TaxID=3346350 RepID=UPI0036DAC81C
MTPALTLVRPEAQAQVEVGNDGMTDMKRAELADAYHDGIGNKTLSQSEKDAFAALKQRS